MSIREMKKDDLNYVLDIEKCSFLSPWTRRMFEDTMDSSVTTNLVLEINDEIIGYIMFFSVEDEAHIMNLAVHPDHREKGYGSSLIAHAVLQSNKQKVTEFFLEVRESNIKARRLYERFGFKMIGKRKGYYVESNEDALVMHLSTGK